MARIKSGSIAIQLFWLTAGWLVIALVATALLLTDLYSRALDRTLTDTLEFHLETLVDRVLNTGDPQSPEIRIADPRFERTASGWYWLIRDADNKLINLSSSMVGGVLLPLPGDFNDNNVRTAVVTDPFDAGMRIRAFERQISLGGKTLRIVVTGSLDEILTLVEDFRDQTFIVLSAVGVMLAIMSAIVARIALRPIGRLRAAVERVREGESDSVTGTYPRELSPLADEVNELLRSNSQIIERARAQVGNLAHGLKTPLAVLRNEAKEGKTVLEKVMLSEADKMQGLVTSYLNRARLAARTTVVGKRADAAPLMARLVRVMGKLHAQCDVSLEAPARDLPWFRGEESDLEEMAGNLLDNACKWAKSRVVVSLAEENWESGRMLIIRIEDDGKGLTEDEARKVLRRGVRLDEKTPGSGLGLDIVKELVDVYGGSLQLGRSSLGGLRAELRMPSARSAKA